MAGKKKFAPRKLKSPKRQLSRRKEGGANSLDLGVGAVAGAIVGKAIGKKIGGRNTKTKASAAEKVRLAKQAIKNSNVRSTRDAMVRNKKIASDAMASSKNYHLQADISYRGTRFTPGENKNARALSEAGVRSRQSSELWNDLASREKSRLNTERSNVRSDFSQNLRAVETAKSRLKAQRASRAGKTGTAVGTIAGLAAGWLAGELRKKPKR